MARVIQQETTAQQSVAEVFSAARAQGRKALIPFITAGYPSLRDSERIAVAALEAGADILEIGAPFSDPLADGPAIQYSSQQALAKGLNLNGLFDLVRRVRARTEAPLLLMGYYNPLLAMGVEKYLQSAAEAGASGLIIPDLPPDEAGTVRACARELGLSLVFLVAPTSTPERIALVDRSSTDFVYAVTVAGVTGARTAVAAETSRYLRDLRQRLSKPFVAGFGVSTPALAAQLGALADGVVVGSALVETIRRAGPKSAPAAVARSVRAMRRALDAVR